MVTFLFFPSYILLVDNNLMNTSWHYYANYHLETLLYICAFTAVELKGASFAKYEISHIISYRSILWLMIISD